MEKGEISQLKVYESAIKHCSDQGNRRGVEMFGRLICNIAGTKLDDEFSKLDEIMFKDVRTEMDLKNARTHKNNVEIYQGWLDYYSPEAPRYIEHLSQAEVNSWKQGDGETSCP